MSVVISIALFCAAGYAIVSRVVRLRWDLAVATSFLVGSGWASLVLLAMSLAGLRWSAPVLVVAILAPLSALLLPAPPPRPRESLTGSRQWHLVPDAALVVIAAGYGVYSVAGTPSKWDFWAIWGLKARIFFEHGGVDWAFLRNPDNQFVNPDYPLLVPLVYDVPAVLSGQWTDSWLGLIGLAYSIAVVLIVRGLAIEELRSTGAASLIAIGASGFALSVYVGLAEVPLIAYCSGGLLLLRAAVVSGDGRLIRLAAVLIGFGALTKNEGIAAAILIAAALLVETRSALRLLDYSPALAGVLLWISVRASESLTSQYLSGGALAKLLEPQSLRLPTIASGLASTHPEKPLFWITVLLVMAFGLRLVFRRERLVVLATSLQFAAFIAAYAFTSLDVAWQIRTSWPRLLNQIAIPVLYVAFVRLVAPRDRGYVREAADADHEID